ncbi:MAG TPA: type II toxin-antitoxin system RelB/DinJ family antitoxin [Candidatus Paceibacterota bacterium]|jgi:addiction module RelB/DinJ family antitoxin|nr:type II toxin-antitoxin system RelB/DinJ family antitoxin [Candidatus Paceibacterota bacterium]
MKTSALSIKIDPKVKHEAQKVADQLGFSLSAIINASLKNLVRSKTVSYSLLEPAPLLKKAITSARAERARGKSAGPFYSSKDMMKSLTS